MIKENQFYWVEKPGNVFLGRYGRKPSPNGIECRIVARLEGDGHGDGHTWVASESSEDSEVRVIDDWMARDILWSIGRNDLIQREGLPSIIRWEYPECGSITEGEPDHYLCEKCLMAGSSVAERCAVNANVLGSNPSPPAYGVS